MAKFSFSYINNSFLILGPPITAPPNTEGKCPEDWEEWGDSCFFFDHTESYGGSAARAFCEEKGAGFNGTLASIHTLQVNRHIMGSMAQRFGDLKHGNFWIGMERLKPGEQLMWLLLPWLQGL